MTEHDKAKHSSIGASGSHRWLMCPGSVQAEGRIKINREINKYADEGTAAHRFAEICLRKQVDAETYLDYAIVFKRDKTNRIIEANLIKPKKGALIKDGFPITEEMVEAVQIYLDHVRDLLQKDKRAKLFLEHPIDLTHLHADLYGTLDAAVLLPALRQLHIIDLKYGKGVAVSPVKNPQLKYYGTGALYDLNKRYAIDQICLTIVQPRAPHASGPVRTWRIQPIDLIDFGGDLIIGAQLTRKPNAPRNAGEHCQFCRARPYCAEAERHARDLVAKSFDSEDGERLGYLMKEIQVVENFCREVRKAAFAYASSGKLVQGWKMAYGRSTRNFRSQKAAIAFLKRKFKIKEADMFTEPELKSPAQIEKLLPAKMRKGALADIIDIRQGRPILIPADDKRQGINA